MILSGSYNWTQKTCKLLNNKFPGSDWSLFVMAVEHSEVYGKVHVQVAKFCMFFSSHRAVTNHFVSFWWV